MKKYMALITLVLITTPAFAVTSWDSTNCDSTRGVVTTINGNTFCKSKEKMNWWSAFSWCQAMGGRMPSIQEICPGEIVAGRPCGVVTGSSSPKNTGIWGTDGYGSLYSGTHSHSLTLFYYCLPNGSAN